MSNLDKLVVHQHGCEKCSANLPGTNLKELKLCPEGQKLRDAAFKDTYLSVVGKFVLAFACLIGGCALVGSKLGAEVGIGLFLVAVSARLRPLS